MYRATLAAGLCLAAICNLPEPDQAPPIDAAQQPQCYFDPITGEQICPQQVQQLPAPPPPVTYYAPTISGGAQVIYSTNGGSAGGQVIHASGGSYGGQVIYSQAPPAPRMQCPTCANCAQQAAPAAYYSASAAAGYDERGSVKPHLLSSPEHAAALAARGIGPAQVAAMSEAQAQAWHTALHGYGSAPAAAGRYGYAINGAPRQVAYTASGRPLLTNWRGRPTYRYSPNFQAGQPLRNLARHRMAKPFLRRSGPIRTTARLLFGRRR